MAISDVRHPSGGDFNEGNVSIYGEYFDHLYLSRLVHYGHSYGAGAGASDVDRDILTRVASMTGTKEVARSVGGAILHWNQTAATGDGGWAHIWQHEPRKQRANTVLSAQATAGAATISVTGTAIANFDHIMVGIGDTGATGGEILRVISGGGTSTLTIQRPTGELTVARTHANGQPVFVVPSDFINLNPVYLHWYGINDLAASPIGAAAGGSNDGVATRFRWPTEAALSRYRTSEVYENIHTSCRFSANGWAAAGGGPAAASGTNVRQATNSGGTATVTFGVPDNFKGGTVVVGFVGANPTSTSPVWSFTVDGVSAGTLTVLPGFSSGALVNAYCKRLTGLSAGRHEIVVTFTTTGSGAQYFDWWGIESREPPVVIVPGVNRPYNYSVWPTWTNRRQVGQLNMASVPIGTTAWTFDALAATPLAGASFTLEEGTGDAETLEVAASPAPSTTSLTTTTASTIVHADNDPFTVGQQDADVAKINSHIQSVIATFDVGEKARNIFVDIDSLINKDVAYHASDGAHFNDYGQSTIADKLVETIFNTKAVVPSLTAAAAVPTAPLPSVCTFTTRCGSLNTDTTGVVAWQNQPAAATELFGSVAFRKPVDLRRSTIAKLVVGVLVTAGGSAVMWPEYSIDNGTTWASLFRSALFADDVTNVNVAATGMRIGAWGLIAAGALINECLLRIRSSGGNGALDTIYGTIDLYYQ